MGSVNREPPPASVLITPAIKPDKKMMECKIMLSKINFKFMETYKKVLNLS